MKQQGLGEACLGVTKHEMVEESGEKRVAVGWSWTVWYSSHHLAAAVSGEDRGCSQLLWSLKHKHCSPPAHCISLRSLSLLIRSSAKPLLGHRHGGRALPVLVAPLKKLASCVFSVWAFPGIKTSSSGCHSASLSLRCFLLILFVLLIPSAVSPSHCSTAQIVDVLPMHHGKVQFRSWEDQVGR